MIATILAFCMLTTIYIQKSSFKIDWPYYLIVSIISTHLSYKISFDYFLIIYVMITLSLVDVAHREIPRFSYWFVFIGILITGRLSLLYFLGGILVFCMLWLINKFVPITMGGADLKLLIMLIPFFPTQLWVPFLLCITITGFFCAIVISNKDTPLEIPLIPSISASFFILLSLL